MAVHNGSHMRSPTTLCTVAVKSGSLELNDENLIITESKGITTFIQSQKRLTCIHVKQIRLEKLHVCTKIKTADCKSICTLGLVNIQNIEVQYY